MRGLVLAIVAVAASYLAWSLMGPQVRVEPVQPTLTTTFQSSRSNIGRSSDRDPYEQIRDRARKAALAGLDLPWSSFCTGEGREKLFYGLNFYFVQRTSKANKQTDGSAGNSLWATADDNRIERKIREIYGRGYFTPEDLSKPVRGIVADLVRSEKVSGRACPK
jgi:hypothetical protein